MISPIVGVLIVIIGIGIFTYAYSTYDKYVSFPQNFPDTSSHRVCRCLPYHHKAVQGDEWGKYIRCPSNTVFAGQEYWCTSDSPDCVGAACNYLT